jgi:hypothetical protein
MEALRTHVALVNVHKEMLAITVLIGFADSEPGVEAGSLVSGGWTTSSASEAKLVTSGNVGTPHVTTDMHSVLEVRTKSRIFREPARELNVLCLSFFLKESCFHRTEATSGYRYTERAPLSGCSSAPPVSSLREPELRRAASIDASRFVC